MFGYWGFVAMPRNSLDASNKQYVDERSLKNIECSAGPIRFSGNPYYDLQSYWGDLDFDGERLRKLGTPVDKRDAVTKEYCDSQILSLKEELQKMKSDCTCKNK